MMNMMMMLMMMVMMMNVIMIVMIIMIMLLLIQRSLYVYYMHISPIPQNFLTKICACKISQILCDISHQLPKYRVISCGSKKKNIAHGWV